MDLFEKVGDRFVNLPRVENGLDKRYELATHAVKCCGRVWESVEFHRPSHNLFRCHQAVEHRMAESSICQRLVAAVLVTSFVRKQESPAVYEARESRSMVAHLLAHTVL